MSKMSALKFLFFSTFCLCILKDVKAAVPLKEFFPFGPAAGDEMLPRCDDCYAGPITLEPEFGPLAMYVNSDGFLSSIAQTQYSPTCGRLNQTMISGFWADANTDQGLGGAVYYRQSKDNALLEKAKRELAALRNITENVAGLFIATWQDMPFYGASSCGKTNATAPRNTFQVVLATVRSFKFAIYYYNSITWTTGMTGGGNCSGLAGSRPAKAGYDFGYVYGEIAYSCTEGIINIADTSNVGSAGKWVFYLDVVDTSTTGSTTAPTTSQSTTSPPTMTTTSGSDTTTYTTGTTSWTEISTTSTFGTTSGGQTTTSSFPETTTSPTKACNGRGTCKCDSGYTGYDCSQELNWCQEKTIEVDGHPIVQSVCGDRGICVSSPSGARCVCHSGFTGQYCDQLIPEELWLSKRCSAYNGSHIHSHASPDDQAGCGKKQECVPDDLQCLLTPCNDPIGWCLPNERAKDLLFASEAKKVSEEVTKWWQAKDAQKPDCESCSGHGHCECDSGYQGDNCEQEVNWCETPIHGFNQSAPIKNVCGNGTCISQPSGATCICEPGFTGQFCHEIIPTEVHISRRCYRYAPSGTTTTSAVPIGCAGSGDTCVPDNLQCLLDPRCKNPIGWCLPLFEVDPLRLRMMFTKVLMNPDVAILY